MRNYRLKLDLQLFNQEKTEQATPKKREESRNKGQVGKSSDMPGAFILLFVFASFLMLGDYYRTGVMGLFNSLFEDWLTMQLNAENVMGLFLSIAWEVLLLILPVFAIAMVFGVIGNVVQFGFLLTGHPLKMELKKLDPIQGFKRIFSMRSLAEFLKSILKVTIIALLVYSAIAGQWESILILSTQPLPAIFAFASKITINLGIQIGAVMIVLSFLDFMYQKYEHNKSLKMSKQDIKDEFKKTEGDPLNKGRVRERQRKMALQRMMQDVPKADVVITNPTHFAIAIQYDATQMEAPKVLAKGMDHVALRIKEIAKEHDVVTMENKPLARALYDQAEIGDVIPSDLFQAVAEVLAYVYKMKGRIK